MLIRYYCHAGQLTGYGRAASDLCTALLGAGVELDIRPLSAPNKRDLTGFLPLASHIRRDDELHSRPDVVIVHTLPVDCHHVKGAVEDSAFRPLGAPPWIAYTTWEALTRPVELRAMMSTFSQVWHPSRANAEALGPAVEILPHCFDPETLAERRKPTVYDEDNFNFYYVGAWTDRKNVTGLVTAFLDTFPSDSSARLFLQCAGAEDDAWVSQHRRMFSGQVVLSSQRKTDEQILAMHRTYDCFVTASLGEAWNLPCFDAMLAGRHIIAPFGSGSDDYLLDTDASLVRTHVGRLWREPDQTDLVRLLRAVYEDRDRTLNVNYDPALRYGYPAVAKQAIDYITRIL